MPLSYSKNKKHTNKWIANNTNKWNELCRINQRKYDNWKRIQRIYLSILLDI